MKKLFVLFVAITMSFTCLIGQTENGKYHKKKKQTVKYHPSSDGYNGFPISVKMMMKMDVYWQEPLEYCVAKGTILDDSKVFFEGNWYNKNDFDPKVWKAISFKNMYDIEVDVYQGSARLSTMKFSNILDMELLPSSPNWNEVFPGLTEKQAKHLFEHGYSLRNMRVTDLETQFYGFYLLENEIEKRQNKDKALNSAKAAEQNGDIEEAIEQYKIAARNAKNEAEQKELEDNASRLKAKFEKEQELARLTESAEQNLSNDNLEAAQRDYEKILSIDPQNSTARSALAKIETKKKEQKSKSLTAEAKKARDRGDNETAKKKLDEALANDPNNREASVLKAEILEEERIERRDTWRAEQEERAKKEDEYNQAAYNDYSSSVGILASLLFMNMGNDGPSNRFDHNGMNFRLSFDFNMSGIPVAVSSETEYYDGNEYYTSYSESSSSMSTLNIGIGMEWGIIRTSFLDIGVQGKGMYGMGMDGESLFTYSYGGNVALGYKGFKVFSKCNMGAMSGGFNNFDYSYGASYSTGGYFEEDIASLEFGIRILFDGWDTKSYLEASKVAVGNGWDFSEGYKFTYGATNRMQIAIEYYPEWYLTGEGSFYKIGLVRTFDYF